MSSIQINNIKTFRSVEEDKTYLLLIKVNLTPPHIALIQNGGYYSYSTFGAKVHSDVNAVFALLNKKQTPTLLLELESDLSNKPVLNYYKDLNILGENQSCLFPIKNWLTDYNSVFSQSEYVFDVIPLLEKLNLVSNVYSLHTENLTSNNSFFLNKYSQKDINNAIKNSKQLC